MSLNQLEGATTSQCASVSICYYSPPAGQKDSPEGGLRAGKSSGAHIGELLCLLDLKRCSDGQLLDCTMKVPASPPRVHSQTEM